MHSTGDWRYRSNPGPSTATDKSNLSGPSFVNTSLMDVIQAIHLIQLQLDQLSTQVQDLTNQVKGLTQTQQTRQTKQEVCPNEAFINLGGQQEYNQHAHLGVSEIHVSLEAARIGVARVPYSETFRLAKFRLFSKAFRGRPKLSIFPIGLL